MKNIKIKKNVLKKLSAAALVSSMLLGGCSNDTGEKPKDDIATGETENGNSGKDNNVENPSRQYELWEIVEEEPNREELDAMDQDYVSVYAGFTDGKPVMDNLVHQYKNVGDKLVIGTDTLEFIGYKICPCRYRKYDGKFIKEILYSEEYDESLDSDWTVVESMFRSQSELEKEASKVNYNYDYKIKTKVLEKKI